jgi:hypothetical protein
MRWRRAQQAMPIMLAAAGLLSGCYYDPSTGLTSAYPPPYGYPQPAAGEAAAPGLGEAPAPDYGGAGPQPYAGPAPGYGEAAPQPYATPPPQGYGGAPPAYGGAPPGYGGAGPGYGGGAYGGAGPGYGGGAYGGAAPGYGGAPGQGGAITRAQYVQRAMQRASAGGHNPQVAAQRAGAVFDQIDVYHTGVITRAQLRAWRQAHARPAGGGQPQPGYEYQ